MKTKLEEIIWSKQGRQTEVGIIRDTFSEWVAFVLRFEYQEMASCGILMSVFSKQCISNHKSPDRTSLAYWEHFLFSPELKQEDKQHGVKM